MYPYRVWPDIDELAFHESAIFLEACDRSQQEQSYEVGATRETSHPDFTWAKDFLDDFALIAAGPGGASNVTAACLELDHDEEDSIIVRVAKNENFNSQGCQRLSRIIEIMNQVRKKDLSISSGQDLCFDLIVEGCRPRIMKQIGPKGLWDLIHQSLLTTPDGPLKVLYSQRENHSESQTDIEKFGEYSFLTHETFIQLAASRWAEMIQLIDQLESTPNLKAIKQLACLSYDVRRSDSFHAVLEAFYRYQRQSPLKVKERLGKVAKFFRSAVNLINVAASHNPAFKLIKVTTVPSISRRISILRNHTLAEMERRLPALSQRPKLQKAEVKRLLNRWQAYIVHAEMLLLVFYEENPQVTLATNYIGISKRSCYLCANFIRMHNYFTVEGQHQQLYCLWALPEEINFESQLRSIAFVKVLKDLQCLIATRVDLVSRPSYRSSPYNKESVANFSRETLLARAHSLEKLDMIKETDEFTASTPTLPPLAIEKTDIESVLEGLDPGDQRRYQEEPDEIGIETLHIEDKQHRDVENPSPGSAKSATERLSSLNLGTLPVSRTSVKTALSTEKQPSKYLKDPKARTRHTHRRRHKHQRTSIDATDRCVRQREVRLSSTTVQPHRSTKRRNPKRNHSSSATAFKVRDHNPTRRHSKRRRRKTNEFNSVGCSGLLVSCLRSLRGLVLSVFARRH